MGEKDIIYQGIEKLKKYVLEREQETFKECAMEIMEKAQVEGFMSGYEYAISILRDGIVDKK